MRPKGHLSGHEEGKILVAYCHGIQIVNIAGDIGWYATTVLHFLNCHRREVWENMRLGAKKLPDAVICGIIRRARTGL